MDNENQYGTYERQCILLEMMKELHSLFLENGIKYSISGGTALGAVRHGGFIPWDDDIDIICNRENYNKLVHLLNQNKKYGIVQYTWVPRIVNRESEEKKIYIDLFIVDNVPDSNFAWKIKVLTLKTLQGMMKRKEDIDYSRYGLGEKLLVFGTYVLGKMFSLNLKKIIYTRVSEWGNNSATEFINEYNSLYKYLPHKYPVYMIEDYIVTPFENAEFLLMKGYDEYLTIHYGSDYMTPPPALQRIPQHMQND